MSWQSTWISVWNKAACEAQLSFQKSTFVPVLYWQNGFTFEKDFCISAYSKQAGVILFLTVRNTVDISWVEMECVPEQYQPNVNEL